MRHRFFLALAALLPPVATALLACGPGVSIAPEELGGGPNHHDAGLARDGATERDGSAFDAHHDALPDYVDPGCPDAGEAPTDYQCDPLHPGNGDCGGDAGCFIYVKNPTTVCGKEIYGSTCLTPGPGAQGAPCHSMKDCAAGFVCTVSGSGTKCLAICDISGSTMCPAGLVCEPIDILGYGGCM